MLSSITFSNCLSPGAYPATKPAAGGFLELAAGAGKMPPLTDLIANITSNSVHLAIDRSPSAVDVLFIQYDKYPISKHST